MRVVFVLPNLALSGGVKIILEYAEYLRLQGHEVTCLYPAPRRPSLRERLRAILRNARPVAVSAPSGHLWGKDLSICRSQYSGAASMADMPDADIVIASWWETAEWIAQLPPSKGIKCHFIQDHEVFPGQPVDRVKAVYGSRLKKFAVSRWLADILKKEYSSDDIILIPNGIQTNRFHPGRAKVRDRVAIGHLWTSTPRKNSIMAIEALKIARNIIPELRGLFFGGEIYPPELKDIDWVDYVRLPLQSDIPALYAQCHCWLFTSITEGFGLPLLESLASGTPVVATRAGAAPDLIDDANGRLIDCTADAMAQAIVEIVQLPDSDWLAMSNRARRVAEDHDWIISARKIETELQAILMRHGEIQSA